MAEAQQKYRVPFVERTGLKRLDERRGYAKLSMPLAGNENHVNVMYLGAYTVLAEAAAAVPGISVLDVSRYFPIIKDIFFDFHKSASTDVTAEFGLDDDQIDGLLADLNRKGSATYVAQFPMHDTAGATVATARVTVKLLSLDWKK